MCFILCCCCNWCNSYSSKCVEITILILSVTSFSASMIGYIFVNKDHTSKEAYGCLIVVIIFSIVLILSIILILIWRFRALINNTRNTAGSAFSKIGLITTIFCILFTGIWESMSMTRFYELNYPCESKESTLRILDQINLINAILRKNRRYLLTFEENKEEFCLENPNYNAHVVSTLEYIYLLISATVLEIILLVLLYFWYNDFRRIKYLVDGKLIDSNTKENKKIYEDKKNKFNNNNFNLMLYGSNDYVAHYDIYGRPIFNIYKKKSKTNSIKISNFPKVKEQNKIKEKTNDEINNKNKVEIGKIVHFENNSSERTNIYNLNFNRNRNRNFSNINLNLNLNASKNLTKINENESSAFQNIK